MRLWICQGCVPPGTYRCTGTVLFCAVLQPIVPTCNELNLHWEYALHPAVRRPSCPKPDDPVRGLYWHDVLMTGPK
jgi:hypothetical protein